MHTVDHSVQGGPAHRRLPHLCVIHLNRTQPLEERTHLVHLRQRGTRCYRHPDPASVWISGLHMPSTVDPSQHVVEGLGVTDLLQGKNIRGHNGDRGRQGIGLRRELSRTVRAAVGVRGEQVFHIPRRDRDHKPLSQDMNE